MGGTLSYHACSTPLNASAFGVTLDSSIKSRPGQQTKSTSPGRLQFGVIICYNKIKRSVTGQCSAYHEMVVLDLVWTTDPAIRPRSEMVRRRSRWVKIWVALFNGL